MLKQICQEMFYAYTTSSSMRGIKAASRQCIHRDQKLNFIAIWICRIGVLYSRLEMTPAVAVPMLDPGPENCGWLNALKNSSFNWCSNRSRKRVFFTSDKSA